MKAYEIPVSRPVLKMLKRDYAYDKHMRLDKMMLTKTPGNCITWERYINSTTANQVRITVICPYASTQKLYTIAKMMENEFKTKMLLYVEAATEVGMEASLAIRNFLDKYDVPLEELELDTAYKQWQRYKKKESKKNLIALW